MFAGLVPKGLNCHILTLYAGGDESRPRYREAIVIKLQLLHQRNIILYNTHTQWSEIFRFPFAPLSSPHIYQTHHTGSPHLDFVVALTRGIPSVILLDLAFLMTEHIPDAQSFSIFVPGSFCLIG